MRRNRRFTVTVILVLVCVYLALLLILFGAEAGASGASIRSLGDAFWFSLSTLTTVGYGDMLPVTPVGHVIGIIFLFLSMGMLIAVVGTIFSVLSSEVFPVLVLSFQRKKNWYYFADTGLESMILAENISADDPRSVIIFGQGKNSLEEKPDFPCQFINVSPERIVRLKGGAGDRCKIFFMKENDIGSNQRAIDITDLPAEIYARTTSGEDSFTGNFHFFHSYDCCAREYWRSRPLTEREHRIVLISFGYYGQSLIKYAIMSNILSPDQHVAYHIFGNTEHFLTMHPGLAETFCLGTESETGDSLIFHREAWKDEREIIESADRIIICCDIEPAGWNVYWEMKRFYRVSCPVDLRSSRPIQGLYHFGSNESIYTPKNVIRTKLNRVAVAMNDLYRDSDPEHFLEWDELDDFLRQSKIAASEHMLIKVRILLQEETITELTPENLASAYDIYQKNCQDPVLLDRYRRMEHERWRRFYSFYNWTCGPARSTELRQDPQMSRYEDLSPEQKAHSDYAWNILGILRLGNEDE